MQIKFMLRIAKMSIIRRYFDPIRSRWYAKRQLRSTPVEITPLSIFLRLDDVYSYLIVQILDDIDEILVDHLRPLKIYISTKSEPPPSNMSQQDWQAYCLNDAKTLAIQHRFSYDDKPEMPSAKAIEQAQYILQQTPLTGRDFLYLLEDVFHMLWQQQYHKLDMLYLKAQQQQAPAHSAFQMTQQPILTAYFDFAHRQYHAVDGLLRLTRRLQQLKLLTAPPIFLINHIEWREHLIQGVEEIADIQALQPELDVYLALEDPTSWLVLSYLKEQLVEYYNIKLTVYPIEYQARDEFDWGVIYRVAQRAKVKFAPFCRPTAHATLQMSKIFYSVAPDERHDMLCQMLEAVWTQGYDFTSPKQFKQWLEKYDIQLNPQNIYQLLAENTARCQATKQPNLPVMVLSIDQQVYVFNSFYRVWLIESIFSSILEQRYKQEQVEDIES